MKIAALDLGSNTSLLLVAEVQNGQLVRVFHDESRVTKMGQEVHAQRALHPEALKRLEACFVDYQRVILANKCDQVIAVATSAARDAQNGQELLQLGQKYGIPIQIVEGKKEAELTFKGALCDRPNDEGVAVIDVGGGSTEIIYQQSGSTIGVSVDVGSVRLNEMFIAHHPTPGDEVARAREYAMKELGKVVVPREKIQEVVAVAGTPTTLVGLELETPFDENKIHGFKLSKAVIEKWISRLSRLSLVEREALRGMQPKRAEVIVVGATILASAMNALGVEQVTVSTRGVRYGVALAWQEL